MEKPRNTLRASFASCLLMAAASLPAHASLLLYEGFDYTANETVIGKNGGFGNWSTTNGAWRTTGTPTTTLVVGGSLGYTDTNGASLVTDGGSLSVTTSVTGGTFRNISGISVTKAGGGTATYWLSFVGNTSGIPVPSPTGTPYAALTFNTNDGDGNQLHIGAFGSSAAWRIRVGSSTYSSAAGVPTSTAQAFIVMRVDVDLNGDDSIHLWVNPALSSEPSLESATSSITGEYWSGASFSLSLLRIGTAGTGDIGINVDEIRLGTTYPTVAPLSPRQ